jgi:hypothetical protein
MIPSGALKNSEIQRDVLASRLAHEIYQDIWFNCLLSGFRNSIFAKVVDKLKKGISGEAFRTLHKRLT